MLLVWNILKPKKCHDIGQIFNHVPSTFVCDQITRTYKVNTWQISIGCFVFPVRILARSSYMYCAWGGFFRYSNLQTQLEEDYTRGNHSFNHACYFKFLFIFFTKVYFWSQQNAITRDSSINSDIPACSRCGIHQVVHHSQELSQSLLLFVQLSKLLLSTHSKMSD